MIDWNDNAKDAIEEYREWIIKNGKKIDIFLHNAFLSEVVECRSCKKTVKDAVEYYNGVWPDKVSELHYMSWDSDKGIYTFAGCESTRNVCTRAEFEAYVKEQEGEKWTHTYNQGEMKCKIIQTEPDFNGCVVVFNDFEEYQLIEPEHLKPIKPTITKAEAWDKVVESKERKDIGLSAISDKVAWVIENYDII